MGPELGGNPRRRIQQALARTRNFDDIQKDIYGQFENTFMMYLPRLCEHCLNPACVATCPSGSIYKREEDGIVLIDQDKCRGWRMCVSRLPVQEDLLQLEERQGREVHLLLSAHRSRASPRCARRPASGRIRYLGVLLYDADRIQEAASVEHDRDLYQAQLDIFLDPNDPKVIAQAAHRRHSRQLDGSGAQQPGLQDGGAMEGGAAAAPGIPHAADGLVRAAAVADQRGRQRRPRRAPTARFPT